MIKNKINYILENIAGIKQKNGIDYDINLVAVTKNFPAEDVLEAYNCGITLFGENRIQEADIKYNSDILKEKKLELHIIGHLQRNKAKTAVKIASMIQSIDKIETLDSVERHCSLINKKIDYLLEINTSNESQKMGVFPEETDKIVEEILKKDYKFCNIRGVMTVGPLCEDQAEIRKSFRNLKNIFEKLNKYFQKKDFDIISMGMSGDYPIAIEEGGNLIRIGTGIFGKR
jgi:hypothetical protein